MTILRKAAAALSAAAAILIAIPSTASATPARHDTSGHAYGGTLVRENFNHLPLGPVTKGRGWTTDTRPTAR